MSLPRYGAEPSVKVDRQPTRAPRVIRNISQSMFQRTFGVPEFLEHLQALSEQGVHVPSFRYQTVGKRAIYAEVDYIQPVYENPEDVLQSPEAIAKAMQLPRHVKAYTEWSSERGYWTLGDIHNLYQYSYGVNTRLPHRQPEWWLIDLEPLTSEHRWLAEANNGFALEVANINQSLPPSIF